MNIILYDMNPVITVKVEFRTKSVETLAKIIETTILLIKPKMPEINKFLLSNIML